MKRLLKWLYRDSCDLTRDELWGWLIYYGFLLGGSLGLVIASEKWWGVIYALLVGIKMEDLRREIKHRPEGT